MKQHENVTEGLRGSRTKIKEKMRRWTALLMVVTQHFEMEVIETKNSSTWW